MSGVMNYVVRVPRCQLPIDCFDIYIHLKNVRAGMVDENSLTELYLRDNVYNVVLHAMPNTERVIDVTYALMGDDIAFSWLTQ